MEIVEFSRVSGKMPHGEEAKPGQVRAGNERNDASSGMRWWSHRRVCPSLPRGGNFHCRGSCGAGNPEV